jgi:hypothetical protein
VPDGGEAGEERDGARERDDDAEKLGRWLHAARFTRKPGYTKSLLVSLPITASATSDRCTVRAPRAALRPTKEALHLVHLSDTTQWLSARSAKWRRCHTGRAIKAGHEHG